MGKISEELILSKLKEVYDPEIPFINIVDLGLIYDVKVDEENNVYIKMTLTTPGCPLANVITEYIKEFLKENVEGVKEVHVELVWDPPWTPKRMSPEAKRLLGIK